MASDISITTWTGIASCALSCGCWLGAASQGSQAKQLGNARTSQLSGEHAFKHNRNCSIRFDCTEP